MARKRKPLPLLENITIEAVAAEGKCITRVDEQVIFVPFCVPGDVVDLQVVKKKHKYCEAKVVRFIKKSEVRQEPMCEHFGICGGCKWQNLPYEEQIKAKQKQVEDQLTRIGKIELPEFRPIMGSVKTQEYRNKIEFGCSNKRWFTAEELAQLPQKEDDTVTSLKERHAQNAIGFHITGAFDKIYPIKKCWLMDDLCNEIRNFVFEYADSHDYTFYDLREQHGLLRNMMIRNSNTGEWMLVFQFHYDEEGDEQRALELMQQVADKFPQITSLMYVDNQKGNDTINDLELSLFKGNDHIYELMEDLKLRWVRRVSTRPIPSRLTTSTAWPASLPTLPEMSWFTTSIPAPEPSPTSWLTRQKGNRYRVRARGHRGCQGEFSGEQHREHPLLCRRHEGYPDQRFHRTAWST